MTSGTAKRVVVYRFEREPLEGFINPGAYLLSNGVELLSTGGALQTIPFRGVKAICFVADFGAADLFRRHQLFERRPRSPGLWTRFTFIDNDQLDGLLSHNLLEWPAEGYMILPPRSSASRQRVFIPREALRQTELRGVVGGAAPAKLRQPGEPGATQLKMFD